VYGCAFTRCLVGTSRPVYGTRQKKARKGGAGWQTTVSSIIIFDRDGTCPLDPALPAAGRQVGGVKSIRPDHGGHNIDELTLPGCPALRAGSFTFMRFIIFIGIVQSILFLGHWFLYRSLVRFLGVAGPAKLFTLKVGLGLLSVSLVLTSLVAFRYSNILIRMLYTTAASWLGIVYMLILASILCWILYGLARLFHFSLDQKMLIETLIGLALLASLYGFINAEMIRITRISLELPGLPKEWKGKTALWVSDTHFGQVRNHGFSRKIAGMAGDLKPDIIFIGGDLYDGGEAMDLNLMIEPFSRLSAPYGTYFITGNHEEFSDNAPYLQAVRRAGIRVLYNEKVELDGLQIIGVDYGDSRNENQFKTILQKMDIDHRKPSILLKHVPFDLKVAKEAGISLQVSGHTHQGQVFLFRWITSRVYHGYDYGLKWFGDLLVYTSSGAGTWGPPMRLDTKPEIVVITFM
jgi:predicted MPP superfamily phosphohydrolase